MLQVPELILLVTASQERIPDLAIMKVALVTIRAGEVLLLRAIVQEEVVVILLLKVVQPDHILQAVVVVLVLPDPILLQAVEEVLIRQEVAEVHPVVHHLEVLPEVAAEGANLNSKFLIAIKRNVFKHSDSIYLGKLNALYMKTLHFKIALLLGLIPILSFSQNETDVLRFSQSFTGGTARSIGMGGSFGALGGDIISLSINPAGLGVYRSSEFTFSPTITSDKTKATYLDNPYTDSKQNFILNNIGYVYTLNTNKDEGWVSFSFGIGYNRLNDFNRNVTITARNPYSSLLDGFAYNLNSSGVGDVDLSNDPYYMNYEGLAQHTQALWFEPSSSKYINYFTTADTFSELQTRSITTKGGIGEYAFSFGANYSHKLYLGVTIGIDNVSYQEEKVHTESQTPYINLIDNFSFMDYFKTWGTGVNLKLGVIYKPVDFLRLGLAIHTPTYYMLSSDFYSNMDVNYKKPPLTNSNQLNYSEGTNTSSFDYNITTPTRIIPSIAFQFGKVGVLNVDYEYLDYSAGSIRADGDPFTDVNGKVQNMYRSTGNLKIGTEIKLGDFALRGGLGFYGSPYRSSELNKDASTTSYSLGLGYRGSSFFFDMGYIMYRTKYKYALYTYAQPNGPDYTETSDLTSDFSKFVMTLGFRF